MEKGSIPVEDRRIVIPEPVYLALEDMAAEKRKKADEIIKPLITPKSLAQKILAVATKRGASTIPRTPEPASEPLPRSKQQEE